MLDLHKSWHGLHWLICQDAWEGPVPLRYALFGGDEVGEDLGYGSAQVSPPARVGQVAAALNALDAGIVLARYDGRRMDELDIYPGGWGNDRSWRGDMQRDFGRLRDFYRRASSAGDGVVTWLE